MPRKQLCPGHSVCHAAKDQSSHGELDINVVSRCIRVWAYLVCLLNQAFRFLFAHSWNPHHHLHCDTESLGAPR